MDNEEFWLVNYSSHHLPSYVLVVPEYQRGLVDGGLENVEY